MKISPPELPIPFRMVHTQQNKLNRLGSERAKAKKKILIHVCTQNREPPPPPPLKKEAQPRVLSWCLYLVKRKLEENCLPKLIEMYNAFSSGLTRQNNWMNFGVTWKEACSFLFAGKVGCCAVINSVAFNLCYTLESNSLTMCII